MESTFCPHTHLWVWLGLRLQHKWCSVVSEERSWNVIQPQPDTSEYVHSCYQAVRKQRVTWKYFHLTALTKASNQPQDMYNDFKWFLSVAINSPPRFKFSQLSLTHHGTSCSLSYKERLIHRTHDHKEMVTGLCHYISDIFVLWKEIIVPHSI
jgi:hypothetical protein